MGLCIFSLKTEDCLQLPENFPTMYSEFQHGNFVVKHTKRHGRSVPLDQALKKAYTKPAKGQGGVIGLTRRKEAVAQWSLIKHEKAEIARFLPELCHLDNEDEYSLHHKFRKTTTYENEKCVQKICAYILQRGNQFEVETEIRLMKIVTGKHLDTEKAVYLLTCIETGEKSYKEFKITRMADKSKKLFDKISKNNIGSKRKKCHGKQMNVKKETIDAMKFIEIARSYYDIHKLLQFQLTKAPLNLTKDGFFRKTRKSELECDLITYLKEPAPTEPPMEGNQDLALVVIDFMAYAREVAVKQLKLETFGDFAENLLRTFFHISKGCGRIDIVFDLYLEQSIKSSERLRRGKCDPIEVTVNQSEKPLPVEMERFWASQDNKMKLQQFFIKWILENYHGTRPIYLGGSHVDDISKCLRCASGSIQEILSLHSDLEEADHRIMFHANHALTVESHEKLIIASADTDVFVCALYHFRNWAHFHLRELWVLSGQGQYLCMV